MNEERKFAKALETLCALAKEQGDTVSRKQLEDIFSEAGFSLEKQQIEQIEDYLKQKRIGVGEPVDPDSYLSEEEGRYLDLYLKQLEAQEELTEGEKEAVTLSAMAGDRRAQQQLIQVFLPQVAQIARLYAGQGVGLEDLVGEGNLALAAAVGELKGASSAKEAQGTVAGRIMEAMEDLVEQSAQEEKTGEKLAKWANEVQDKARSLAEELGRKVTVEELAQESGMSEKRIREAVRITAEQIDYLEKEGGPSDGTGQGF